METKKAKAPNIKVNAEDLAELKGIFQEALAKCPGTDLAKMAGSFKSHGVTFSRFVWDVWHGIGCVTDTLQWEKKVYEYANDDHVESALTRVIRELDRNAVKVWKE